MKPITEKEMKKRKRVKHAKIVDALVVPGALPRDLVGFPIASASYLKGKSVEQVSTSAAGKVPFYPSFKTIGKKAQTILEDDKGLEDLLVGGSLLQECVFPVDLSARSVMAWVDQDLEQMNSIYQVFPNHRSAMEAHIGELVELYADRDKLVARNTEISALKLQATSRDKTLSDQDTNIAELTTLI